MNAQHIPDGFVGTAEALARAGITERQFGYWLDQGAVTIAHRGEGSGQWRWMTEDEASRLEEIGRVVAALHTFGVGTPLRAVKRWWLLLEGDSRPIVEYVGPLQITLRP